MTAPWHGTRWLKGLGARLRHAKPCQGISDPPWLVPPCTVPYPRTLAVRFFNEVFSSESSIRSAQVVSFFSFFSFFFFFFFFFHCFFFFILLHKFFNIFRFCQIIASVALSLSQPAPNHKLAQSHASCSSIKSKIACPFSARASTSFSNALANLPCRRRRPQWQNLEKTVSHTEIIVVKFLF